MASSNTMFTHISTHPSHSLPHEPASMQPPIGLLATTAEESFSYMMYPQTLLEDASAEYYHSSSSSESEASTSPVDRGDTS